MDTVCAMCASDHVERRDFLHFATAGAGAVAAGATVWPLVNQMNPSANVRAVALIPVDIPDLEPGTQLTVKWRGNPVFIRYRTDAEIALARADKVDELPDTYAHNPNTPDDAAASDENRAVAGNEQLPVMIGVCTHLGCVPPGDGADDFGGWFCPCHGSHYVTAGRIRKGPAPQNLHTPTMALSDDTVLTLG